MFRVLFDRAIRYSVPQYQRSTFDRAVAGLTTGVLSHPVIREVFSLRLSVRLGCKALRSAKSAPKGRRNVAARRGQVEGSWTLWCHTRAL
jgi:hypothetical protein